MANVISGYSGIGQLSQQYFGQFNLKLFNKAKQIEELKPRITQFAWLKSAIDECEKRPEGLKQNSNLLFVYLSFAFTVLAVIAAFIKPYISLGLGVLALVFIFLMFRKFQVSLAANAEREEVLNIFAEFESNFGKKAKSIASLKSEFETIQPLLS